MVEGGGLTALEVLGVAIKSEVEAASLYARLRERVGNSALAAKLRFLQTEEEKHRTMLEDEYQRRFPEVALRLPPGGIIPLPREEDVSHLTVPELFRLAMKAEQSAAAFYAREAERSRDEAGRVTLRYLSNVEQGHYQMLETEYELVSRFPDYYNADDFHLGQELMHIGP
ncbi:MAG TPA: ferritin family protein [Anaerolineae bacterium]|nr:ferritin family protein [Anaerolineae bacterium]HQJ50492.1 ferritin family protein [Anaerolineae bacterium]